MDKKTYFWIMFIIWILTIIFWIVTVSAPSILRWIMNRVLGLILLLSGVSSVMSAIKNKNVQYIWILLAIGILSAILGILLMCGWAWNFIWKLTMILFALWALMRGCILIFNGIQTKWIQNYRLLKIIAWGLLVLLSILTVCDINSASALAWICIGLSIIFDGVAIIIFSFKIKNSDSIQMQVISQASQQEISQENVVASETVVITNSPDMNTQNPQQMNQ